MNLIILDFLKFVFLLQSPTNFVTFHSTLYPHFLNLINHSFAGWVHLLQRLIHPQPIEAQRHLTRYWLLGRRLEPKPEVKPVQLTYW